MKITANSVVSVDYEYRLEDGSLVGSSQDSGQMVYIQGYESILPAIEQALDGKTTGDTLEITLSPSQAYGEKRPELVFESRREYLPQDQEIKPGMVFYTGTGDRQPFALKVIKLTEDGVLVDGNHPLAGQTLQVNLKVLQVRGATAHEIETRQPSTTH